MNDLPGQMISALPPPMLSVLQFPSHSHRGARRNLYPGLLQMLMAPLQTSTPVIVRSLNIGCIIIIALALHIIY